MSSQSSEPLEGAKPGLIVGRYELLKPLSRGGMGEVFEAREIGSGRLIAYKRLREDLRAELTLHGHFRAEYEALARLRHPRIIQVYEYGVEDNLPFYSMELLSGQDLKELAPAPYREACAYLRDVASSLALLHAQRLLHRDVSPRNVRRTEDGTCKLLDFGTMVPFGIPKDVAGTAPFVAPEAAAAGVALDQRTDLYSLGALGYWLLSGRHAVSASTLDDLPAAWLKPAKRLRRLVPEIPEALDTLIMSLLEHSPLKRPDSAADVIERLNAIAQLAPEATLEVAHGYLASAKLCARDAEVAKVRGLLQRAASGAGAALSFVGAHGVGKTRLLDELAVLGQTQGFTVLRGYGASEQGGQFVSQQLRAGLEQVVPDKLAKDDARSAEKRAASMRRRVGAADHLYGFAERANEQAKLSASFVALTQTKPLLLLIDDLDRADEFSASLVTSLAHQARELSLVVVVTLSAGRTALADDAVERFQAHADMSVLNPLTSAGVREFLSGVLGEVPNLERLADFLERTAGGNPGLTMELMRLLVSKGQLRYQDGIWLLPEAGITEPLPKNLVDALALRVSALPQLARSLAEHVAMMERHASLALCLRLSDAPEDATQAALLDLVKAEILTHAKGSFGFAQEALRDAVREQLSETQQREIHLRVGRALLAEQPTLEAQLSAGAHLVRSADELRGADLLVEVAPKLMREGRAWGLALPALERALEVYERHGVALKKSFALRQTLVMWGYLFDYRLALRYGERTLLQISEVAGMPWLTRLSQRPFGWLTVPLALGLLMLLLPFRKATRSAPNGYTLLVLLGHTVMGLMGVRATSLDAAGGKHVLDRIAPFQKLWFAGLYPVYLCCRALNLQSLGREGELQLAVKKAHAAMRFPYIGFPKVERLDLEAGLLLAGGINECYRIGSEALVRADELEALGTPLARASAQRIRMTFYTVRGDRARMEQYRRLIELHGIQGGTTWQVEWFAVPIEGMAATRYGDIVTARRALTRLEQLAEELPSLVPLRDMLRIGYLARRGDLEEAVSLGEQFLERYAPRTTIGWGNAYADIAGAYNRLGRFQRAKEICERGLKEVSEADREYMVMYGPLELEFGIARAGLGSLDEAEKGFAYLRSRLEAASEHALLVILEEAQAKAVSLQNDVAALRSALGNLKQAAERTGISSLIAHAARVAQDFSVKIPSVAPSDSAPEEDAREHESAQTSIARVVPMRTRLRRALTELREYSRAESSHLFQDGLETPLSEGKAPSSDLQSAARRLLAVGVAGGGAGLSLETSTQRQAWKSLEDAGYTLDLLTLDTARQALLLLEKPKLDKSGYEAFVADIRSLL